MQAVILAAGRGERMRPLTDEIPKPLIKIGGQPILQRTIDILPDEISEIILVIGYKGEMIKEYLKNYQKKKITYVYQEELSGTAGALFLVKNLLRERFLVLMADDLYCQSDIEKILKHELAILAKETNTPERFGVFRVNQNDELIDIVEKPVKAISNLVNIGIYTLTKKIFDYQPVKISDREFGLPQTMVTMTKDTPIKIIKADFWCPIGYPEDLEKAEKCLQL